MSMKLTTLTGINMKVKKESSLHFFLIYVGTYLLLCN